jgi:hypoxanthine phosphoribosyltransferase
VIHSIEPWVSDSDIPPGVRWFDFITKQLNDAKYGIICITKDNFDNHYILFEAGALAKTIDNESWVCPYLIDLTPKDLSLGPLNQFQATKADEEGTWNLIKSLNESLGENSLNIGHLQKVFKHWWPDLRSIIKKLPDFDEYDKNPQISGSLSVKCDLQPYKIIEIKKLNKISKYDRLELKWETLGSGIEYLAKKILQSSACYPNIIFGINETGFIIASYLSRNLPSRPELGLIKTGEIYPSSGFPLQYKRRILHFDFPNVKVSNSEVPLSIAIVDIEIKSGVSIDCIINEIEKRTKRDLHIDEIIFYYFVLCGVLKEGDEGMVIDDIKYFGWDKSSKRKPDLMAYYIEHPGIRGPGGIR